MWIRFEFDKQKGEDVVELQNEIVTYINRNFNCNCNANLGVSDSNFTIDNVNYSDISKLMHEVSNEFKFKILNEKLDKNFATFNIQLNYSNDSIVINNLEGQNQFFKYRFKDENSMLLFFKENELHNEDEFVDFIRFCMVSCTGDSINSKNGFVKIMYQGEYSYYFAAKNNETLLDSKKIFNDNMNKISYMSNEYGSINPNGNEDFIIESV